MLTTDVFKFFGIDIMNIMHNSHMLDMDFKKLLDEVLTSGKIIPGRTGTKRLSLRHTGPRILYYDLGLDGNELPLSGLRKASPMMPIAETLFYLTGSDSLKHMAKFNKTLADIWTNWASDSGYLGGVYGPTFRGTKPGGSKVDQFKRVINMLRNTDTRYSTHIRMTSLIPDKFPIPGNSYDENFFKGLFTLMPCMHSYYFMVSMDHNDEEIVSVTVMQSSADIAVGLVPHNVVQASFLLKLVSILTGIKPGAVHHVVDDVHCYENQIDEIEDLVNRKTKITHQPTIEINTDMVTDELFSLDGDHDSTYITERLVDFYKNDIKITGIDQLDKIDITVDS